MTFHCPFIDSILARYWLDAASRILLRPRNLFIYYHVAVALIHLLLVLALIFFVIHLVSAVPRRKAILFVTDSLQAANSSFTRFGQVRR